MNHELRCECGWRKQISEAEGGEPAPCPRCGRIAFRDVSPCVEAAVRHTMNANRSPSGTLPPHIGEDSGRAESTGQDVPYGYPPYTSWGKKIAPPVVLPRRRVDWKPEDDPYAKPAFWLGFGAVLLSLVGCGALPAILLAIFALQNASNSRRFCTERRVPRPTQAGMGSFLGVVALLIVASSMFSMFAGGCATERTIVDSRDYATSPDDATYIVEPASPEDAEHVDRPRPQSDDAESEPLTPRDDFEAWQSEYSTKIRNQRSDTE